MATRTNAYPAGHGAYPNIDVCAATTCHASARFIQTLVVRYWRVTSWTSSDHHFDA